MDKQSRAECWAENKSVGDISNDLNKASIWLLVAAIVAFGASSFYVVKYFVGGSMSPSEWNVEQWLNAFLGLGLTAVITASQAYLYSQGYKSLAANVGIIIVVFFGAFTEIGNSMEREEYSVRERSAESPVFQALVGNIGGLANANATISPITAERLKDAARKVKKIQTQIDNKNECRSCVAESFKKLRQKRADAEGELGSIQAAANLELQSATTSNQANLSVVVEQAKSLERNEDYHFAMIRLLKNLFGITAILGSFLFSFIIIGTFEYAFYYVGSYVADGKKALRILEYDKSDVSDTTDADDLDEDIDEREALLSEIKSSGITDKQAKDSLTEVWRGIDAGVIKRVNAQGNGDINQKLVELGVGTNNESRRPVIDFIIQSLLIEKVILPKKAHNKPYPINPRRKIRFHNLTPAVS